MPIVGNRPLEPKPFGYAFCHFGVPLGEPIVENRPLEPEPVGLCLAAGGSQLSRTGASAPPPLDANCREQASRTNLPGIPAPPTPGQSNPQTPWGRQGEPWPLGLSGKKTVTYDKHSSRRGGRSEVVIYRMRGISFPSQQQQQQQQPTTTTTKQRQNNDNNNNK